MQLIAKIISNADTLEEEFSVNIQLIFSPVSDFYCIITLSSKTCSDG